MNENLMAYTKDEEILRFKRGLNWVEVKESLQQNGCPACNIMKKHLHKYFDNLLYENALDVTIHKKIISYMGLCNMHTWVLSEFPDKLGISILFQTTLQKENRQIKNVSEFNYEQMFNHSKSKTKIEKIKKFIFKQLQAKGKCLACEHQQESQSFYIHQLIKVWSDEEFREQYERENVLLCRFHFQLLISECNTKDMIKYFFSVQSKKIDRLYYQLSEFIRKHDYRFQKEMTIEDGKSLNRTLEYLGSQKNISKENNFLT